MDVVVVGASFSGSLVATLVGRQGYNVTLIDRCKTYPDDFHRP